MDIDELIQRFKKFKMNDVMAEIFQSDTVQKRVIALNQEQLFMYGIRSDGTIIKTYAAHTPNVYAPYTIQVKAAKGQKTNVVTLYDTGGFYRTFKVKAGKTDFNITANFKTKDGNISDNVDTTNVLGLTEINKEELMQEYRYKLIEVTKTKLLQR